MYEIFLNGLPILCPLAAVFIFWILFKSKPTALESSSALDGRIGQGKPVLLRFFKNT